jgi:hypothetical protein
VSGRKNFRSLITKKAISLPSLEEDLLGVQKMFGRGKLYKKPVIPANPVIIEEKS